MAAQNAESKVSVITGAATGMGRQTAVELAKKGWKVAILDYNETIGRQTAEEIGGSFYKVDVRSWKEQFDAFEQVLASYGRVDFVFANAGKPDAFDHFDVDAPTLTAERAPDMEVLDINLLGGCYTAILALSAFRRNPSSVQKPLLVLTSSGAGLYPVPVQPLYGAAKHGIVGLARSMGLRHKDEGFRVCALVPGLVPTTIMPKTIVDRVDQSLITPTTHIAAAIQDMLDNTDLNATVCEASVDRIFYRDPPDFPDVAQRRVLTEVSPNMAEDFKKLRDGTL